MMVSVLAAVLEFQRDMISENTREGVAAAEAAGKTLSRPATLDPDQAAKVVETFGEGAAVKALARRHQVDPKTIRRVLDAAGARDLPGQARRPPGRGRRATPAARAGPGDHPRPARPARRPPARSRRRDHPLPVCPG
ncbi:recombinase family protein [Streptomyces sp. QHH-9511]|uniref:recombinase family protein n=1 Tax=Streptomyces sp. QHH-9511 TaxID=2684468 RepID=UPI0018E07A70